MNNKGLDPCFTDDEIEDLLSNFFENAERNHSISSVECQCGADNVYGSKNTAHSDWCPKYKKK